MDFVNRLRPEHLQSFWYFSSKVNFALIGTFGSLLWATSPSKQEADFYKARLSEYRWTLRVSSRGADFMEFAVGVLDASAGLLQQEQWRKRGPLVGAIQGYRSTVGSGENLGLGMGVGLHNAIDLLQPPPPPPPGWRSAGGAEIVQCARGQLSPVTNDAGSDDDECMDEDEMDGSDEDDYDEMMDDDDEEEEVYSDETGREAALPLTAAGRYAAVSAAANARRGQSVSAGFAAYQAAVTATNSGSTASTPASTTSSVAGMDFFMIPNTGFGSSE